MIVFDVEVEHLETSEIIRKFKTKMSTIEELVALYRTYKKDYSFVGLNIFERKDKNELVFYVNDR